MSKKSARVLGKGLSALMSDSYGQSLEQENTIKDDLVLVTKQSLPINKLKSGKYQPREYFNDIALQELSNSIAKNGIMQPILVRKTDDDMYEIIAGERRWRAARMAGLDEVSIIIRDASDEQTLELAIVENVQREDLHALEEAKGYQRLMDEFGYTQENIASTVNKSRSHIANLLRLLSLPDEIQELFLANKLSMGHARALINSENPKQLADEVIMRGLNVRQTEKLVSDSKQEKNPQIVPRQKEPKTLTVTTQYQQTQRPKDPDIMALEDTLSENLGLKVSINDRGQMGEIMISYQSLEQLDEILRRLGGGA
jgi:ParB family transcriptional regulator, chromosome partitioning protein